MPYFVKFDGVNDLGRIDHHEDFNLKNNFDIEFTFSPYDLNQSQDYVFTKSNAFGVIWEYTNNKLEFYTTTNTSTIRSISAITLTDSDKHKVRYVYDGSVFRCYLDDVLIKETTININLPTNTQPIYFGAGSLTTNFMKSSFYHFSIKKDNVLVGEWKFGEGSGDTVADSSGNGHTMTLSGEPEWDYEIGDPVLHEGSANLSSSATATASANMKMNAPAKLSAESGMTARPSSMVFGEASLTSFTTVTGELSSVGQLREGTAQLSAETDMDANAEVESMLSIVEGEATLATQNDMDANAILYLQAEVFFSSVTNVDATGTKDSIKGEATLGATTAMSTTIVKTITGNVVMASKARMTILNVKEVAGSIVISGSRDLYADMKGGIPLINGQNLNTVAGNTLIITAKLTEQNGEPMDLESIQEIQWGFGNETSGLRKDTSSGITILDSKQGLLVIHLRDEDTKGRVETTKHELKVTDYAGNVSTVLRGILSIERNII